MNDKKKDKWDKFSILASLLLPASITAVGLYYANIHKAQEITIAKNEALFKERLAVIETRSTQAELMSKFIGPLLSTDPYKRKLAIHAVKVGLPDQSPALLAIETSTTKLRGKPNGSL